MAAAEMPLSRCPAPRASALVVAGQFARHLLAFWFPGTALAFLATGPHSLVGRAPLRGPADRRPRPRHVRPPRAAPAAGRAARLALRRDRLRARRASSSRTSRSSSRLFAVQDFFSFDFLVAHIVVGASSGYSIITAHELIHREGRVGPAARPHPARQRALRALLHRAPARPSPARRDAGGSGDRALRRDLPPLLPPHRAGAVQERVAAREEAPRRRVDVEPRPRACSATACCTGSWPSGASRRAIAVVFGWVSLAAFVLQGWLASRLLEIVNYFEHWGLERQRRARRPERVLGHARVVHVLVADRPLAPRRPPHLRRAPVPEAPLLRGGARPPARLRRHDHDGDDQEPRVPPSGHRGARAPPARPLPPAFQRGSDPS